MSEFDYALAIDIGNSRVVSAIARVSRGERAEIVLCSLGTSQHSTSSGVFADAHRSLFFGDDAERLGAQQPERMVREFLQSVGADAPVMVGGHAVAAEELYARMCAWIVDSVTAQEGAPPAQIAITHPPSWVGHRQSRLLTALTRVGIGSAILVAEPIASARRYEIEHPLKSGQLLAVYDLGGTRFDAWC
ncbi:hypothetical protein [Microbacterium sp. CH12i]|uniref:hypothetical protein n=1 Tax=Microbacterium sp. CH12i TaxID=1479651 RepID=UPI00126860AC|nr:hypothetical protein [Microbacterium sp. CH12i]